MVYFKYTKVKKHRPNACSATGPIPTHPTARRAERAKMNPRPLVPYRRNRRGIPATGLARKIVTLLASILIYGHEVNTLQCVGLTIAVGAMVFNFLDKGKKKGNKKGE